MNNDIESLQDEIRQLRARCSELERDALRYRWIRSNPQNPEADPVGLRYEGYTYVGEDMDGLVDDEMQADADLQRWLNQDIERDA